MVQHLHKSMNWNLRFYFLFATKKKSFALKLINVSINMQNAEMLPNWFSSHTSLNFNYGSAVAFIHSQYEFHTVSILSIEFSFYCEWFFHWFQGWLNTISEIGFSIWIDRCVFYILYKSIWTYNTHWPYNGNL